jgi:hypothetical protein
MRDEKLMQTPSADMNMLIAAYSQKDVYPKALASFMFREIIEDAHVKYNISQEDMKAMCKKAVSRAAAFIAIKDDPRMYKAFAIHSINGFEWDESEMTEDLMEDMVTIRRLADLF